MVPGPKFSWLLRCFGRFNSLSAHVGIQGHSRPRASSSSPPALSSRRRPLSCRSLRSNFSVDGVEGIQQLLTAFAGGRLFGSRTGDRSPRILALHGWRRTHHDFDAILNPIGASPLEAAAPDLPGFGETPAPPQAWGSREYADVVSRMLEEMATPVVVLGHSFGGTVALQLAALAPDQVQALVLTGVPRLVSISGPSRRPNARYRAIRRLNRIGIVSDRRMEETRQRYGSADYRAASGIMREVFVRVVNERYDDLLPQLACPVTLVWGESDTDAPVAVAKAADQLMPDSRLVVLPSIGHLTPLEAPSVLRDVLQAAMQEGPQ